MLTEYQPIYEPNLPPILEPNILPDLFVLPYAREIAKQVGKRDHWRCTDDDCDRSFQTGWLVDIAHPSDHHTPGDPLYQDPNLASTKCLEHHKQQHLDGTNLGEYGDIRAVELIQERIDQSRGGHTRNWISKILGG